jgi:hypothetical protein
MANPLLLASLGLTAGAGAVQGITGAMKTKADKEREEELRRREQMEKAGLLGLSDDAKQHREQQLMNPLRAAATEARQRASAAMATHSTSGQDQARLREEQTRAEGEGAQRSMATVMAEDIQTKKAQQAHTAQLRAVIERRAQERRAAGFGAAGEAARAGAALAGAVPEATRIAGMGGMGLRDKVGLLEKLHESGASDATISALMRMPANEINQLARDAVMGVNTPEALALRELLLADFGG